MKLCVSLLLLSFCSLLIVAVQCKSCFVVTLLCQFSPQPLMLLLAPLLLLPLLQLEAPHLYSRSIASSRALSAAFNTKLFNAKVTTPPRTPPTFPHSALAQLKPHQAVDWPGLAQAANHLSKPKINKILKQRAIKIFCIINFTSFSVHFERDGGDMETFSPPGINLRII